MQLANASPGNRVGIQESCTTSPSAVPKKVWGA